MCRYASSSIICYKTFRDFSIKHNCGANENAYIFFCEKNIIERKQILQVTLQKLMQNTIRKIKITIKL